jgi:hypothetical protein
VRSDKAGLDLIACSTEAIGNSTDISLFSPLSLLGANYLWDVSVIRSDPISVNQITNDERFGTFALVWSGMSTSSDQKHLVAELNKRITDIQNAIAINDIQQLERSLAPLVMLCAQADKRRRFYRSWIRFLLVLLVVAAAAAWLFRGTTDRCINR